MEFQKRREELLEFLRNLPKEQFDYSTYWDDGCGTVGCVAGWCRARYRQTGDRYFGAYDFSKDYLGLTEEEAGFLFLHNCAFAKKEHAIKRLEWLVNRGSFKGYPKEQEVY